MKTLAKILCIAILMTIPAALFADRGTSSGRIEHGRSSAYEVRRGNVSFYATVTKAPKNDKIELSADGRKQKVRITRDTIVFCAMERRTKLSDLHKGDRVHVDGYQAKNNEIVATSITLYNERTSSDTHREDRMIQARVVKDTAFYNRTLRVTSTERNSRMPDVFSVKVPKGADVTRNGSGTSVHEIRTGDSVCLEGRWDGSTFTASRIQVNECDVIKEYDRGRDYRAIEGRIRKIDYRGNEFTLSTDKGELSVYADRARVWRDGDVRDFKNLNRGDVVYVRGNIKGDSVDAERIEVGHTRAAGYE